MAALPNHDTALDVSVILPVYNEHGHLRAEIDRIRAALDASRYTYEIVVVDDGSDDGSGEALLEIEGHPPHPIRREPRLGLGTKSRNAAARGDVVVWTDTDMTYPNDQIPGLVDALAGHDQVVGARTSEQGTQRAIRVPAKWFIRRLASYLMRTKIPDLNSGFRAFRRDVALQYLFMLPRGFSCVTTMTMTFSPTATR